MCSERCRSTVRRYRWQDSWSLCLFMSLTRLSDMKVVAVVQARMGSTRLPGKMMLPLGKKPAITHVLQRTDKAASVDETILATTDKERDELLQNRARELGIETYRGDETDVLGRVLSAAQMADADLIVRIAGDCPLVSPDIIDLAVDTLLETDSDYVSNKINRTFPLGLDVEVFSWNSFLMVDQATDAANEREHVTVYYLDHQERFSTENITSSQLFDQKLYRNRTDIELTLDESADYVFLDQIFTMLPEGARDPQSVIDLIDSKQLDMNTDVERRNSDHSELDKDE